MDIARQGTDEDTRQEGAASTQAMSLPEPQNPAQVAGNTATSNSTTNANTTLATHNTEPQQQPQQQPHQPPLQQQPQQPDPKDAAALDVKPPPPSAASKSKKKAPPRKRARDTLDDDEDETRKLLKMESKGRNPFHSLREKEAGSGGIFPTVQTLLSDDSQDLLCRLIAILEAHRAAHIPPHAKSNAWEPVFMDAYKSEGYDIPTARRRYSRFQQKVVKLWEAMQQKLASKKVKSAMDPTYQMAMRQFQTYQELHGPISSNNNAQGTKVEPHHHNPRAPEPPAATMRVEDCAVFLSPDLGDNGKPRFPRTKRLLSSEFRDFLRQLILILESNRCAFYSSTATDSVWDRTFKVVYETAGIPLPSGKDRLGRFKHKILELWEAMAEERHQVGIEMDPTYRMAYHQWTRYQQHAAEQGVPPPRPPRQNAATTTGAWSEHSDTQQMPPPVMTPPQPQPQPPPPLAGDVDVATHKANILSKLLPVEPASEAPAEKDKQKKKSSRKEYGGEGVNFPTTKMLLSYEYEDFLNRIIVLLDENHCATSTGRGVNSPWFTTLRAVYSAGGYALPPEKTATSGFKKRITDLWKAMAEDVARGVKSSKHPTYTKGLRQWKRYQKLQKKKGTAKVDTTLLLPPGFSSDEDDDDEFNYEFYDDGQYDTFPDDKERRKFLLRLGAKATGVEYDDPPQEKGKERETLPGFPAVKELLKESYEPLLASLIPLLEKHECATAFVVSENPSDWAACLEEAHSLGNFPLPSNSHRFRRFKERMVALWKAMSDIPFVDVKIEMQATYDQARKQYLLYQETLQNPQDAKKQLSPSTAATKPPPVPQDSLQPLPKILNDFGVAPAEGVPPEGNEIDTKPSPSLF